MVENTRDDVSLDAPRASGVVETGLKLTSERRLGRTGLFIAALLSGFVFAILNWPNADSLADLADPLLFANTTPAGGDMGAHVWGPAFLRDHLLPQGRLTGWTPDWYAGFPAYQFYMVVPSLAIIALNLGLPWFIGLPVAALALVALARSNRLKHWSGSRRRMALIAAAAVLVPLVVALPYGVAFKLISVTGLVFFPVAGWFMAKAAGSPEPAPAMVSLAAFVFLFDTNFTIYGGNITSTLAGEFAFSMSLCLVLFAIGLVVRGLDTNRYRAAATVVVALAALCHIIPVFFMMPALMLAVLSDGKRSPRSWVAAGTVALALIPFADQATNLVRVLIGLAVVTVFLAGLYADDTVRARSLWLLVVGPASILLTAFWLLPFYLRDDYFNDMGWERLDNVGPPLLTVPIKIALPVAAIGALVSYVTRDRIGMIFTGTGLVFAAAVANLGEGALWNARLLPFYYLSVYVLAAIGVSMVLRFAGAWLSNNLERPNSDLLAAGSWVAAAAVLIAVAMPLRLMPFGRIDENGSYRWLAFTNTAGSAVPGWTEWNYSGYERKKSYGEYHQVVSDMAAVGADNGCGRAMWEYSSDLDRYGTPMALMLLPHWTDGCIGSMEGLYFESSATTPFHFLNQSTLSDAPSRAQRDLPYRDFDINLGIAQLQLMGVKYYMAMSDTAIAAADAHPELTRITESQPFVIFEVDGSQLVQGLEYEPVVVSGRSEEQVSNIETVSRFDVEWVGQAVEHYNDVPGFLSLPAEDGPDSWMRAESLVRTDGDQIGAAVVDEVTSTTSSIKFIVDEVGKPVLVKASYFPNWDVDGADGPWRAGPNLMVVVPTESEVELNFGRTAIDWLGNLVTILGLAVLFGLYRFDRRLDLAPIGDARATSEAARLVDSPEPAAMASEDHDEPDGGFGTELDADLGLDVETDLVAVPAIDDDADLKLDDGELDELTVDGAAATNGRHRSIAVSGEPESGQADQPDPGGLAVVAPEATEVAVASEVLDEDVEPE